MVYTKPYPAWIDRIWEFPRGVKCPDFHLFNGSDGQTTMEHIGRFTLQCGELAHNDFFKLRLFPSSLTGTAFSWWLSLRPDSIHTWQDLERSFHNHFYEAIPEITVTEISSVTQEPDEKVINYINRFRKLQSRCTTDISEKEYVKMAKKGLRPELRLHFAGINFYDLCHLVTDVSDYEQLLVEENQRRNSSRGTYYKNQVSHIEREDYDSDFDEHGIALAELDLGNKKPYVCKSLVKPDEKVKQPGKFTYDITKTDTIFDILLKDKKIKLPEGHVIPKADQLKGKRYCKWHDRYTHNTNECLVLRSVLQRAINSGELALPEDQKVEKKPEGEKKIPPPANVGMVTSSNKESISSTQIAAQGGVYFNLMHPEIKQKYVDKAMMKEHADKYGKPIFCMRCACELASPVNSRGKEKVAERVPVKQRLSYDSEIRSKSSSGNPRRPPVKQTDGLFYDRNRDSYYLKRSRYDEYGPQGQPMFDTGPEKFNHLGSSRRTPKFGVEQKEMFPRNRMIKPVEPHDSSWHKNLPRKQYHKLPSQGLTRTQLRRAQRLYGLRMRSKQQDSEVQPEPKAQMMNVIATKDAHTESPKASSKVNVPKVTLKDLKDKAEKLEAEKKQLQEKVASKEVVHVDEDEEDMEEDEFSESSEKTQFGSFPAASLHMVFTLPEGFKAAKKYAEEDGYLSERSDDSWWPLTEDLRNGNGDFGVEDLDELLNDGCHYEYDEGILSLDMSSESDEADSSEVVNMIPFGKPTRDMIKHVRPLYVNAKLDGRPLGRVMIDNGASINVITSSTLRKLGKSADDLFEPLTTLTNFSGGVETPVGMLPLEVMVGHQICQTAFYVINANVGYNALLGRDWIHQSKCVPSSLHQSLIFWNGDNIEMVRANDKPFVGCINMAEAQYYHPDAQSIDCDLFYNGTFKRLNNTYDDMALGANYIELFR